MGIKRWSVAGAAVALSGCIGIGLPFGQLTLPTPLPTATVAATEAPAPSPTPTAKPTPTSTPRPTPSPTPVPTPSPEPTCQSSGRMLVTQLRVSENGYYVYRDDRGVYRITEGKPFDIELEVDGFATACDMAKVKAKVTIFDYYSTEFKVGVEKTVVVTEPTDIITFSGLVLPDRSVYSITYRIDWEMPDGKTGFFTHNIGNKIPLGTRLQ